MKLHLPTRLRAAVLACFAVVSSFTTTLATGAIAGGAFALAIAAVTVPQALADTATFSGTGNANIDLSDITVPETLTFAMSRDDTSTNYFAQKDMTYAGAIYIDGGTDGNSGLIINDGFSKMTVTFTNKVTGNGLISKCNLGTDIIFAFQGDVSEFTGRIEFDQSDNRKRTKIIFSNINNSRYDETSEQYLGVSGTGDITFYDALDSALVYDYSDGQTVYVTNKIVTDDSGLSTVVLAGSDAVVFKKDVTIHQLRGITGQYEEAASGVANASKITFSGADSVLGKSGKTNTITSTLEVAQGAGLTLAGTLVLSQSIINNGTLNVDDGVIFDLSGMECTNNEWTIFSGNESASFAGLSDDAITGVAKIGCVYTFGADGKITRSFAEGSYVYSGGSLSWDTVSASFDGNRIYENSGRVVFTGDSTVALAENISAESTLIAGNETELVLQGSGNTLTVNDIGIEGTLSSDIGITVNGMVTMTEKAQWNLLGGAEQTLTKAQLANVRGMSVATGAKLTLDGFTSSENSLIDATALNGTGSLVLKLENDNGINFNLANFEGSIRVEKANNANRARLQMNRSQLSPQTSITLADKGDLVYNDNGTLSNDVVVEGESHIYVNSTNTCSITSAITGSGTLAKQGSNSTLNLNGNITLTAYKAALGTTNVQGGTVTRLEVSGGTTNVQGGTLGTVWTSGGTTNVSGGYADWLYARGGTVNVSGGSSGHICVGGTLNIIDGEHVTGQLRMSEEAASTVNIRSGGALTITGDVNNHSISCSLMLAHYPYNSELVLDGGSLNAKSALMYMSWDGTGTFRANSGTAKLKGLHFWGQASGAFRGSFLLGSETEGNARVDIGSDGFLELAQGAVVKLGNGTLGAMADWTTTYNAIFTPANIELIGTAGGTIFDTDDHTVTIKNPMIGGGNLVKEGSGEMILEGTITNTGTVTVNDGTIRLKSTGDNSLESLVVNSGGSVVVEGRASVANAALAARIVNVGDLTLTGTLTIDSLDGFSMSPGSGATYDDGDSNTQNDENGYLTGTAVYEIISNSGTLQDGDVNLSGAAAAMADASYAGGLLTVAGTDDSTYWVNTTVTAAALGAGKKYRINGGTLNVGTDAANILKTAVGSSGILNITENCVTTGDTGLTTQFEGTLALASGVSLTLGKEIAGNQGDRMVINTSSLTAVHLYGGSTLKYHGNGVTTLKNLTVKDGTATLHYIDANNENTVRIAGVTTLNGNLNVTSQYDGAIDFDRLTGAGNMSVTNSSSGSEEYGFSVHSLRGYTGKLSLTKSGGEFDATISTGDTAVAFKGITVANSVDLVLNVQTATTMSEGLSLSNGANVTVAVSPNASLSGAVAVSGVGNSLTSTAGALNLSQLAVAEEGALDVNGAVSALLMNQAGTVDMTNMHLTDGAVLSYGDSGSPLTITEDILTGRVVIASGMTPTAAGLDLGLRSTIQTELIDISAYADSELAVKGDRWYLKQAATRYYWELEEDGWWNNTSKHAWSTTEGGTPTLAQPGNNPIIVFSGDDADGDGTSEDRIKMQWNGTKEVAGIEVSNGYYEFTGGAMNSAGDIGITNGGNLLLSTGTVTSGGLVLGENSSLIVSDTATYNLSQGGDILVGGAGAAISLGAGKGLTAAALDISAAGASLSLSGTDAADATNNVTVSSIELGTDSGLTLSAVTVTSAGLALGENSTLTVSDNATCSLAEGTDVVVGGAGAAISLGAGKGLTAAALDISAAGASLSLSGTGTAGTTNSVNVSSIELGTGSGLTLAEGASKLTLMTEDVTLDGNSTISLGAGQVLDVSAKNYGQSGVAWAKLINATSGQGTLIVKAEGGSASVIQPQTYSVNVRTNVQMSQLKLNYNQQRGDRTLTITSQGSLKIGDTPDADAIPTIEGDTGADGVLIIESTATVKVDGGALSAEHIKLGHSIGGEHVGKLTMTETTTGSIVTGSITRRNNTQNGNTFSMAGGTLTITSTIGIDAGITTTITGGTLVASHADGWGVTGASVGGAAVAADSTGAVTLTNATITGDITGNGKLVLAGAVSATVDATVSGASAGGNTIDAASVGSLTLSGATITGDITGNGKLVLAGAVSATADATVSGASAGGNTIDAASAGSLTLTNATITGDITGNGKLVLADTAHATVDATVSGASVGGITVTTADGVTLTLENTTIGSTIINNGTLTLANTTIGSTITNNGTLELSGTQNVTMDGTREELYSDVYGSTSYNAAQNGYLSTRDSYALVSGTAATFATGTSWQLNGAAPEGSTGFDGKVLTHTVAKTDKVYYINSGSVEYAAGQGITEAATIQLVGGKLVLNKELDTKTTTGGIEVKGAGTALELNSTLAADELSIDSGAKAAISGIGTLELGTGATTLGEGLELSTTEGDAWAGTVKVAGATLSDADLSGLGISGSTIELNGTSGTLEGGTYAAAVVLTGGSEVVLGGGNAFNGGLDAAGGALSIAGVNNYISTLTMADGSTLELDFKAMGVKDLANWSTGPMLTIGTLDTKVAGGTLKVAAEVGSTALLTLMNGTSKVLATITDCQATLGGLTLDDETEQILQGVGGMEYKYTLERVDGTGKVNLIVSATNVNDGWVAPENDSTWKDSDTVGDGKWAGVIGAFYGKGSSQVEIETDGVTVDSVLVSANAIFGTSGYTFTGGEVNTKLLAVNQGSLVLDNAGVNAEQYVVLDGYGQLTVNTGTTLTVGSEQAETGMMGSFISVGGQSKLLNQGTMTVHGSLGVAGTASVTNVGTLNVGALDAAEATITNFGKLSTGGGVVGVLSGDGHLENSGVLSILSDTTLHGLTNSGTLAVDGDLRVNTNVTQGGTVRADNVTVAGEASFDTLEVTGSVSAGALSATNATIGGNLEAVVLTGDRVYVGGNAELLAFSITDELAVGGVLKATDAVATGGVVRAAEAELGDTASFDTLAVTGTVSAGALSATTLEAGKLAVDTLTVGGAAVVKSDTTLGGLTNSGTLAVDGDLTVNAAVTQGGTVRADNVTVAGEASFDTVQTGGLAADALTLTNGDIATLETDRLTVNAGGGVKVGSDVTLDSLSGAGALAVAGAVELAEAAVGTVSVEAQELVLHERGNSFGAVSTDRLTMAEGLELSTSEALMSAESLAALSSGGTLDIVSSESVFNALAMESDGSYAVGDYIIAAGGSYTGSYNWTNTEQLDAVRYTGKSAGLVVRDGKLALSIAEVTDENGKVTGNVWNTSSLTTSNGYRIPLGTGAFYKSLDYVSGVVVGDGYTIDLRSDAVGDSTPGNATLPDAGLMVRNLVGGGTLTIAGNGAGQDVVSIFETSGGADGAAVKVVADGVLLNLGLPEGNAGVMAEDAAATGAELARLQLKNRSLAVVNADSTVTGATNLEDFTRLLVAEGMTLQTGQLLGGNDAEVGGRINVTKSGYYTGQYDEAYIGTGEGAELTLRVGGRRGLSLTAGGGTVKLLSAGEDGRVEALRVGMNPMARDTAAPGSTNLVLDNTTLSDTGAVEHHMMTVANDSGNYINKSTVSLALGAAETARTLNTSSNPVVLDGVVDVLDSTVRVNMIGGAAKQGVLEVNTASAENLTLARLTLAGGSISGNTVTLNGTAEMMALVNKYYTNARLDSNGAIKVDRVTDYYSRATGELSENGTAGVELADAALVKINPQADRTNYKELAEVLDTLDAMVAGGDTSSADSLGASVAGASVAAMGAALAGDMERQLRAIRNRTTTMGVDQTAVNQEMPYFNAWINAEGDLRRLDQDSTYAGYDLSSWGGTVGFDVDATPQLTFGLAVTSMWGDFTAQSHELAEGELQTTYLTAFARYGSRRWVHTFVASVGMSETSLERTVNHANGSYTTEGDADGVSYGFLYEVGYVLAANEAATACIQPVVNVMLAHSSLSGYDESGSSAALSTGDVEMTTLTIGAGVRAQAVMGENIYNRSSIVEARALLKLRAGDREAEAENALLAVPGSAASVKAAEMGTMGAELGIGVTVPVGAGGGSVFADASVDVGGGYTDFNGTVGYRINF